MSNKPDGQALIAAFFAALDHRKLTECEAILGRLQSLTSEQPAYQDWCIYFSGILANERDHDWAEAERIFDGLLRRELELDLRGRVHLAQGRTYEYQGFWAKAIDIYESSLPIFIQLDSLVDQAKVKKQIAHVYFSGFIQGDFNAQVLQQAFSYCQSAHDMLASIEQPSPDIIWLIGSIWNARGAIHFSLEQWDQAVDCYQQDLAICHRLDDRHGAGVSYLNLGEVYQKRDQESWPKALDAYQMALDIMRETKNHYLEVDVLINLGLLYWEMREHPLALDYLDQAIQIIEDMRAGISAEIARASFFATIVNVYAHAILLCLETDHQAKAFEFVERARSRAFLDVLAGDSVGLIPKMEARTMLLAEVQVALPANATLVAYFTTGLVDVQQHKTPADLTVPRHRFPPPKTLIFVITKNDIQVKSAKVSPNDLIPRQLDNTVEQHFLNPQIRRTLYDQLIAPVAESLQDKKRLYLVPHGPLHYIPFQALLAPDGEPLLREDGPQLIYTPSATLLFRYGQAEPSRAPTNCLALGYNSSGTSRLRFAQAEATNVAQLTNGDVIAGTLPKKAALYEQAACYRIFHFACHGDFKPDAPLSSALELAPNETLTALDVLKNLKLQCDLVILSACDSALSQVRRGDELDGFIRAFLYAGAPAVISSLWSVDDRSTRILMEKFYQGVQEGIGFAEALKRAQCYVKNLTRTEAIDLLNLSRTREDEVQDELLNGPKTDKVFADPYYWAAFILIGDHGSD